MGRQIAPPQIEGTTNGTLRLADGGVLFDFPTLFGALAACPTLQRKEWERNKTGADRAMEAVLIQRAPQEQATYALVRLRFQAMPRLWEACRDVRWPQSTLDDLVAWGRTQRAGGAMLANVLTREWEDPVPSPRALAALASLLFYHCRDADNPAVKAPWTEDGFARLRTLDPGALVASPCQGTFWHRKFATVQRLVAYVRRTDWSHCTDEAVEHVLQSLPGIGPQTASTVALFWLGRPVPILDAYLAQLLRDHHLLPRDFTRNTRHTRLLRRHLQQGACAIAAHRPEWSPQRVLACLYLWGCEVGRLLCDCPTAVSPTCPLYCLGARPRGSCL